MSDSIHTEEPITPPNNKIKTIAAISIIIILILVAIGLATIKEGNNKIIKSKILTLEQAKFTLDSLYKDSKKELFSYKNDSDNLYKKLAEKEEQLEQYYVKIKRLISQTERDKTANKIIKSKLKKLSTEIYSLENYIAEQRQQITAIRAENVRLRAEKDSLKAAIALSEQENAALQDNSSALQATNKNLTQKVAEAAVLRVTNSKTISWRTRKNGKRASTYNARRTEILETCFDIIPNTITPTGANDFYLRIKDPAGFILRDKNRGSGKLTDIEHKRIDYTIGKHFDYDTGIFSLCIEWKRSPSLHFAAGIYMVEIYNQGRRVGLHNFTLK